MANEKRRPPDFRPSIRSAWPTPIGKPLTNRMITKYANKGVYTLLPKAKKSKTAAKKLSALLDEFA